jgi:hypothetical protein
MAWALKKEGGNEKEGRRDVSLIRQAPKYNRSPGRLLAQIPPGAKILHFFEKSPER